MKNYQCDICKEDVDDVFFGRWYMWCKKCQKAGELKDREKTYEMEVAPDVDSGDFSYTLEQGLGDLLI